MPAACESRRTSEGRLQGIAFGCMGSVQCAADGIDYFVAVESLQKWCVAMNPPRLSDGCPTKTLAFVTMSVYSGSPKRVRTRRAVVGCGGPSSRGHNNLNKKLRVQLQTIQPTWLQMCPTCQTRRLAPPSDRTWFARTTAQTFASRFRFRFPLFKWPLNTVGLQCDSLCKQLSGHFSNALKSLQF